ncbi:MAG: c-type cytochrome, partial [Pseudomonadales bacterium]|nr:c-type cytochrome [Pseudomonadales bacterium]
DGQVDGEKVFEQACFSCHGTGFYGAPLIGDPYDWEERLARGEAALIANTLQGLNSMPAKGGCATCSDEEIQAAVRYLINY